MPVLQGYSTTSGRFFGGVVDYVASGMPRYHLKGTVSPKSLRFHFLISGKYFSH